LEVIRVVGKPIDDKAVDHNDGNANTAGTLKGFRRSLRRRTNRRVRRFLGGG
jgi:hypothetical protein